MSSMTDEAAALVQAVQDPGVRSVVASISGTSPAQEALGLIGDVIRGRRARTQIKVLEETTAAIQDAGLDPNVVPDKTLVPLLEFAGLEDSSDEDMIIKWANLLANAATSSAVEVPPSYPEILRQLEPVEARFLDSLMSVREEREARNQPNLRFIDIPFEEIPGHEGISWRHLDNLERLGLLAYDCNLPLNVEPPTVPTGVSVTENPLGVAFMNACRRPSPYRSS